MIDLAEKRAALMAEVAVFKKDCMGLWFVPDLAASYTNRDFFSYSIIEDNQVLFMVEQTRQLWSFWNKAKADDTLEMQKQIKVLTADLNEAQSDFAYAYKSVTSWTERAYKQREKVELIKNEVERFQQSGSPLDLNQFLSNLIELATFKNDNEFTDHLLVPAQNFFSHDFNGDGFKYHKSLEEAEKEAEANLDYYRDRVADGFHVESDGEFNELCYGVVIASAGYTVNETVTEEHHKIGEHMQSEIGTEILTLHFNKCNNESGAEQ